LHSREGRRLEVTTRSVFGRLPERERDGVLTAELCPNLRPSPKSTGMRSRDGRDTGRLQGPGHRRLGPEPLLLAHLAGRIAAVELQDVGTGEAACLGGASALAAAPRVDP